MRDLLIWGATGQSLVLHELASGTDLRVVVVVDNRPLASPFAGIPMVLGDEGLERWLAARGGVDRLAAAVAVGGARGLDRLRLMDSLARRGIALPTLVHRAAFVAADAEVGEGCQVLVHATICARASLGRGVILNTAASVDHGGRIGDGAHIGPGARLAGEVTVGARAFVGTGAVILPRITIGEDAIVGAGAVVTKDVPPHTTVTGNPARAAR